VRLSLRHVEPPLPVGAHPTCETCGAVRLPCWRLGGAVEAVCCCRGAGEPSLTGPYTVEEEHGDAAAVDCVDHGSEGATEALLWAVAEARLRGVRLSVVHAWTVPLILSSPSAETFGIPEPARSVEEVRAALCKNADEVVEASLRRSTLPASRWTFTSWKEAQPACSSTPPRTPSSWSSEAGDWAALPGFSSGR
jgi:hypothetical protein